MSWLVWRVPTAVFVIGAFAEPWLRTLLWTPALLLAGAACVVNAAHCGRVHCYFTGPLFLAAAVATVLTGLGMAPLGWSWIAIGVVGGTALAYVPERLLGKYRERP